MGVRRIRRMQRQMDQAFSRSTNGVRKNKERARRDERMTGLIKSGTFPYTPAVLSWLSMKLDKPGRLITKEDVDAYMKAPQG